MEKNIEFEEMKQQLHLLQQRLDKQLEINERQTRRAITEGMGNLRKQDQKKLRTCILVAFIVPVLLYVQGFPLFFVNATFCFLLANAAWRKYLAFDDSKCGDLSMIEASKYLLKYKKNERRAILLGIPLALLWCAFFFYEYSFVYPFNDTELRIIGIFLIFSAVLGFLVGMKFFYLPQMRVVDSLLRQIEEVQEEK